jgi:hypothetical protein
VHKASSCALAATAAKTAISDNNIFLFIGIQFWAAKIKKNREHPITEVPGSIFSCKTDYLAL